MLNFKLEKQIWFTVRNCEQRFGLQLHIGDEFGFSSKLWKKWFLVENRGRRSFSSSWKLRRREEDLVFNLELERFWFIIWIWRFCLKFEFEEDLVPSWKLKKENVISNLNPRKFSFSVESWKKIMKDDLISNSKLGTILVLVQNWGKCDF